jgi:hypothetical protein
MNDTVKMTTLMIATVPGGMPGAMPGAGGPGNPSPPQGPPNNMAHAAARAQGSRPSQVATNHMGPTTALTGNQPGPGSVPIQGGVG